MAYETVDNIMAYVKSVAMKLGNSILDSTGIATTSTSTPLYVDSSSKLAAGNIPFAFPLFSGVTSTSASVISVEGSTTGSANAILTQTLVQGATGSLTVTGFMRVTITDDAGNLTNGAYYVPFGTLA